MGSLTIRVSSGRRRWSRSVGVALFTGLACGWPDLDGSVQGSGIIVGLVYDCAAGAAVGGAQVQVQGTAIAGIADGQGRFGLTGVAPGTYTIRALAPGFGPAAQTITVSAGGTTSVTLMLNGPCGDLVILTKNSWLAESPDSESIVLIQGNVAQADVVVCRVDLLAANRARADSVALDVGDLRVSGTCGSDVAVFSSGDAFRLYPQTNAWTDGPDQFVAALDVSPVVVPIAVWNATTARYPAGAWPTMDLTRATQLFDTNLVGVSFSQVGGGAAPAGVVGDDCSFGPAVHADPTIFQAGVLNVYYVDSIFDAGPFSAPGYYCGLDGYTTPDIIYVGVKDHRTTTLAHELGHAFALQHPNYYGSFTSSNVMWGGLATGLANARNHFTLGQAFRMNIHTGSWLNVVALRPAALGGSRACLPEPGGDGNCPMAKLDP